MYGVKHVVYSTAAFRELVYDSFFDSDVISSKLITSFRNPHNY